MKSFTWREPPRIPTSVLGSIREAVRRVGSFASGVPDVDLGEAPKILARLGFSEEQAREVIAHLWGYFVTSEAIFRHPAIRPAAKSPEILGLYREHGVVIAAREANVPPLGLLRQILGDRGVPSTAISGIISGRVPAREYLSDEEILQLGEACASDASCRDNQLRSAEVAARSEELLVEYFTSRGVTFRTQEELIAQGHTTATPDILFDEAVSINGHVVKWLDNKNYTYAPGGFLAKSAAKQAARNLREWGPGGFCYRGICGRDQMLAGAYLFDTMFVLGDAHSGGRRL